MSGLEIYKKPLLVKISENPKIREFSEQERLGKSYELVHNLLLDLGVSSRSDTEQHKRTIKFISEECGKYTFQDIEMAFNLALKGYLQVDLFQQVNVLVVSKVLKHYDVYKSEKLKVYKQKSTKTDFISDEEKAKLRIDGVRKQLTYFFHNRKVDETRIYVYDVFDKKGLMPTDIEYKNSVKKDAMKILKDHYNNVIKSSREEFKEIKNIVNDINNGKGAQLVWKCKELALEDYLRKELKKESDIERLINLII